MGKHHVTRQMDGWQTESMRYQYWSQAEERNMAAAIAGLTNGLTSLILFSFKLKDMSTFHKMTLFTILSHYVVHGPRVFCIHYFKEAVVGLNDVLP